MAIEGLYEDQENVGSPMVRSRRSSVRRPLGAIAGNIILTPSDSRRPAQKSMQKPGKALEEAPAAPHVFSIAPELSPWTVPDSPVRCPLDEKELARKRSSSSSIVLSALAIGAVLALLAAPHMSSHFDSPPQTPMQQDAQELAVSSYDMHDSDTDTVADTAPSGPQDNSITDEPTHSMTVVLTFQPVEIPSDDATEIAHSWGNDSWGDAPHAGPEDEVAPAPHAGPEDEKEASQTDENGLDEAAVPPQFSENAADEMPQTEENAPVDVDAPPALPAHETDDDDWASLSVEDLNLAESSEHAHPVESAAAEEEDTLSPWYSLLT